jgi:hypothetical protein
MEIQEIAKLYKNRYPEGELNEDRIWFPSDKEFKPCCRRFLRKASTLRPKALLNHCHTIEHLAVTYGVSQKDLRKTIKELNESQTIMVS